MSIYGRNKGGRFISKEESLKEYYFNLIIDELEKEGREIIREAYETKTTGNKRYNQRDAYGYAVYVYGKMVRKGYANESPESIGKYLNWGVPDTGRDAIDRMLEEDGEMCDPKGIALVVANGVFYTGIQEFEQGYRIISQMTERVRGLKHKWFGEYTRGRSGTFIIDNHNSTKQV